MLFQNLFKKSSNENIIELKGFLSIELCDFIYSELHLKRFSKAHQFNNGRNNKEYFANENSLCSPIISNINKLNINQKKVELFSTPFEFYKYDFKDFITSHKDSPEVFANGKKSNYTALIYLNDSFKGGETNFPTLNRSIIPEKGKLLLFSHDLLHQAKIINNGSKYIYRGNWLFE
ncbi:MAG: hypothetical protein RLZZ543_631 [Bacteroidota bacterium]|jgi:hypothetical protein